MKFYAVMETEYYYYEEDNGIWNTGAQNEEYIENIFRDSFSAEMYLKNRAESGAYEPDKEEMTLLEGQILEISVNDPNLKLNRHNKDRIWDYLAAFIQEGGWNSYWRGRLSYVLEGRIEKIDVYRMTKNGNVKHHNFWLYSDSEKKKYQANYQPFWYEY